MRASPSYGLTSRTRAFVAVLALAVGSTAFVMTAAPATAGPASGPSTALSWGLNLDQDGQSTITGSPIAVPVDGIPGTIQQIVAGSAFEVALLTDGTVWAWGDNEYGEMGTGASGPNYNPPRQVQGLTGVVKIVASDASIMAIRSDGTVMAWGSNADGILATGDLTTRVRPTPIPALAGATQIALGGIGFAGNQMGAAVFRTGRSRFGVITTSASTVTEPR